MGQGTRIVPYAPQPNVVKGPKARLTWLISGAVIAVSVSLIAVLVIAPAFQSNRTGSSYFAPVSGPARVAPGSAGCPSPTGVVCYSVTVTSTLHGLTLGNLAFRVANLTTFPGYNTTQVSLGHLARVSVPNVNDSVAGVWWFSNDTWTIGSATSVVPNSYLTLVLDTNLNSNSTLARAWLAIDLTSPFEGAVYFSLFGP